MIRKEYPKVVVIKKKLVLVAFIFILLIMMLIFYNLYQANQYQSLTQMTVGSKVESIANQNDINWYQTHELHKINHGMAQSSQITQAIAKQKTSFKISNIMQQSKRELKKAMSAPISSNQLNAEKQNMPLSLSDAILPMNNFIHSKESISPNDEIEPILKNPISSYVIQAGTIIPIILLTGINSDLSGQIIGQVRSNIYDSISGKYLLIPQGSRLTGIYDSQIVYGQERVLVVWKRIIFPSGQSIHLQAMPGIDISGYTGFYDQVNNHYEKIFGSVMLMTMMGSGAQLAQPQNSNNPFAAPSIGQTLAQNLGTNLASTGSMLTDKNINIQPTLEIRPGYLCNVSVTKDISFKEEYDN